MSWDFFLNSCKELVFVKLCLGFVLIWICFVRSVSEWVQTSWGSSGTCGKCPLHAYIRTRPSFRDNTQLWVFPWLPPEQWEWRLWWVGFCSFGVGPVESADRLVQCLRFCFHSCLSRWKFLQGGGVSSVSSGNLSGWRGAGLLQPVSQRLLTCWGVICQSMWVSLMSKGRRRSQRLINDHSQLLVCVSGVTRCQRRGLRCSEQGDFLPAQPDFLSGMWRCVTSEGEELDWTNSDKPLTDEECSGEDSAANQEAAFLSV